MPENMDIEVAGAGPVADVVESKEVSDVPSDKVEKAEVEDQEVKETNEKEGETEKPSDGSEKGEAKEEEAKSDKAENDTTEEEWTEAIKGLNKATGFEKDALESFLQHAKENKMSLDQATGLANWMQGLIKEKQAQMLEAGINDLKNDWGLKSNQYQKDITNLITTIDRELGEGERFSRALDSSGALMNADVMRGLQKISAKLSEDSLGREDPANADKPETALGALENIFGKGRKKK